MKTCKHIIRYGLASIPAAGGDYCYYCVQEDIEKMGEDSVYVCGDVECVARKNERRHYHPGHAELIGTPLTPYGSSPRFET